AAPRSLQEQGIAVLAPEGEDLGLVDLPGDAGDHRDAQLLRGLARGDLVTDRAHRGGGGADGLDIRLRAGFREVRGIGEEAVSWVDRLGARLPRDLEDLVAAQIAFAGGGGADGVGLLGLRDVVGPAVRLAVDRHRADPELLAGADDAEGDLSAV